VISICGEFRHQTITPTFLACPRRNRVVEAKLASIVAVSGLSGIAMIAAGLVVGAIVISAKGFGTRLGSGDIQQTLALMVLGLVVWSVLGLGVGTLLKNQIAAILVVIGFTFIAEPLLQAGLNALRWRWSAPPASTCSPGGAARSRCWRTARWPPPSACSTPCGGT
jgi:ABC-2 type transport system permease protein